MFRTFVAAAFALLAVPAFAQSDSQSHLSSDPQVVHARALLADDQFEEALGILRPLAPGHPDSIDVRFLVALAAIGASSQAESEEEKNAFLDEAIAALRSILIEHPDLVRVRLELARAFFLKGEDSLSREHFERALAGDPDPRAAANINRFLNGIRARRRWSGYFGAAITPDSNINSASDIEVIYLGGLPFRFGDDSGSRSGRGISAWGGGEYQYPLGERVWLRTGADLSDQEYPGKQYDQIGLSGHAGPRWMIGGNTDLSLLASVRRRYVAGKPNDREVGIRSEVQRRIGRRLSVTGRGSWHRRTFARSKFLDGHHIALSLGVTRLVTSTLQAGVTIGYGRERPESTTWRNATRSLQAKMSVALPWGFTLGASSEFRWVRYKGPWGLLVLDGTSRRKDRSRSLSVSVFNRGFTIFGFSPQLSQVKDVRKSNAQGYDYRRNRTMLSFVQQF